MKVIVKSSYPGDYTWFEIEKPAGFKFTFGQFTTLALPGEKPSYFAIASHPDEENLGFLIRHRNWLPPVGQSVELGQVMGNGFAKEALQNQNLWLITHGSGISAFLAILKDVVKHENQYGNVTLFYGVRTFDELPLNQKYFPDQWGKIQRRFFISRPGSSTFPADAQAGRIEMLNQKFIGPAPAVLLIGSKDMSAAVRSQLIENGIPENHFFGNY